MSDEPQIFSRVNDYGGIPEPSVDSQMSSNSNELKLQINSILYETTDSDDVVAEISPKLEKLLADIEKASKIAWLDEYISHVMFDIYPEDVFTKPTDEDYKKANKFDANLHTRLHCDGIRHGLHVLRREARGLTAREDLPELSPTKSDGGADEDS